MRQISCKCQNRIQENHLTNIPFIFKTANSQSNINMSEIKYKFHLQGIIVLSSIMASLEKLIHYPKMERFKDKLHSPDTTLDNAYPLTLPKCFLPVKRIDIKISVLLLNILKMMWNQKGT